VTVAALWLGVFPGQPLSNVTGTCVRPLRPFFRLQCPKCLSSATVSEEPSPDGVAPCNLPPCPLAGPSPNEESQSAPDAVGRQEVPERLRGDFRVPKAPELGGYSCCGATGVVWSTHDQGERTCRAEAPDEGEEDHKAIVLAPLGN